MTVPATPGAPFADSFTRMLVGAALDLRPIIEILRKRYGHSAEVREFRQGRPTILDASEKPPTYARDFGVDLRIRIDSAAARMVLNADRVDARLAGRLVARRLSDGAGCPPGELAFGVALVVFQSPQRVRDEFSGFAIRMCVRPELKRQCIVHALPHKLVDVCYPDVSPADFVKHVCHRAYLDKKQKMLTVPGSVACYHRWGVARIAWHFYVLAGERPTPWYRGFVRRGMRIFGAAAVRLIADRYIALWRRQHPVSQGAVVPML